MKKYGIIPLALVLMLSLCACGCRNSAATTEPSETVSRPTSIPTTEAATETTVPMMDPTAGTNIPDPTVDSNSTDSMDDIMTEATDTTNATARSRRAFSR